MWTCGTRLRKTNLECTCRRVYTVLFSSMVDERSFYRDVGMRGWTGGSDGTKVMMMELDMPHCDEESCTWDRPAVWALNARVGQLCCALRTVAGAGKGVFIKVSAEAAEVSVVVILFSCSCLVAQAVSTGCINHLSCRQIHLSDCRG